MANVLQVFVALVGLLLHQSYAKYVCEKTSTFTCRIALTTDTTPGSEIVNTNMCLFARNTERGQAKQYMCNFEQKNKNCQQTCDQEQCLQFYIPCKKQTYKMRTINACGPVYLQYQLNKIYGVPITIKKINSNQCSGRPYNQFIKTAG